MNSTISFQFTSTIFAAKCNDCMILLDALNDEYISLSPSSTEYLIFVLANQFILKNNTYVPIPSHPTDIKNLGQIDVIIKNFIKKQVIEPCAHHHEKKSFVTAASSIGLHKRDWMPTQRNDHPKIRFLEFIKAILALRKAHQTIKTKKLTGVIELLNSIKSQKKKFEQNNNSIDMNRLAYTLDNACLMYPKKTLCLPWATALVYLLLKQGIRCSLVIGVQACPFYAHAWVDVDGKIINDNPELREYLAPILKLSFNATTPQTITLPTTNA